MGFAKFYNRNNFQELHENLQSNNLEILTDAIYSFLLIKKNNGSLHVIKNSESHYGNIINTWNNFVLNKEVNKKLIQNMLENLLMKSIFNEVNNDVEIGFNNLLEKINSGNFSRFVLSNSEYCFGCGKRFSFKFENWNGELLENKYNPDQPIGKSFSYPPASPCVVEPIVNVEIEVVSGKVLVADWFRVEYFTNIVDENIDFDVNCDLGRSNQSKHYAENYNFISIPAWNDAEIFIKDDKLFALHNTYEESPIGYKSIAKHEKQLRAISLIDKESLINILSKKVTPDVATDLVNTYIKKEKIEIINLDPGKYRFSFSGNANQLANTLKLRDLEKFAPVFICEKVTPIKKLKIT